MTPAQEFRLTYVSVAISYPPVARFTTGSIKDFAAAIDGQHPFESIQIAGDTGGVLETEGRRYLRLERDSMELQERGFDEGWNFLRKNAVDLLSAAEKHFKIPIIIVPRITLRALSPVPSDVPAADLLREKVLGLDEDQYGLLGEEVRGGSLTVVGDHADPDFAWSVEIAPYLSDQGQVWLEVESNPAPFAADDASDLDSLLDATYDFLDKRVMTFLASVLH